MELPHCDLFDQTATVSARLTTSDEFEPQHLSNLAWAFAKLRIQDKELFAALALGAKLKLHAFGAQNLASLAWAYATLGLNEHRAFLL